MRTSWHYHDGRIATGDMLRNAGQRGKRALALLNGDRGVTESYALAAIDTGLVDEDDLRGGRDYRIDGTLRPRRWFLA